MAYFDKYGVEYSDDRKTLVKCPINFKGEYIIPNSVTSIGDFAFFLCSDLTSVTIPNCVTKIGVSAFNFCTDLTSVIVPNSVTKIGGNAFLGCRNMIYSGNATGSPWGAENLNGLVDGYLVYKDNSKTELLACLSSVIGEIKIPRSVTNIRNDSFCAKGLKTITVESENAAYCDIEGVLFSKDKSELIRFPQGKEAAQYVIPSSVTKIYDGAFRDCINIGSIVIPDTIISVGELAFYGVLNLICSKETIELLDFCCARCLNGYVEGLFAYADSSKRNLLACSLRAAGNIVIPDNVTSLGEQAFMGCQDIISISMSNNVSEIGPHAFADCRKLTYVALGKGIKIIKEFAFWNCQNLAFITIPESVITIERHAFDACSKLTYVEIPNSVVEISHRAFSDCKNLHSAFLGNSVKKLSTSVFHNSDNLVSITVAEDNPNFCDVHGVLFNKDKRILNICPEGLREKEYRILESVSTLDVHAFNGCKNIEYIYISNNITEIAKPAFENCCRLKKIFVPVLQKDRFLQMEGLKNLAEKVFERDSEELTILTNLAKAYEKGIGVTKSITQAFLLYTQAADKGSAESAYRLAEWYHEGEVIPRDLNKALTYFQQAAKSGYLKADMKAKVVQELIDKEMLRMEEFLIEERNNRAKVMQQRKETEKKKEVEERKKHAEEEQNSAYYLFFDTETTGLPPKGMYNASPTRKDIWPRLVQIAWIVTNKEGNILKRRSEIIYPDGFAIPQEATDIHGITTERAKREGKLLQEILADFAKDLSNVQRIVCHNVEFDQHIVGAELYRMNMDYDALMNKPSTCTMLSSTNFCAIPNPNGYNDYKWPKLPELYRKLFHRDFEDAHDALADVTATKECYFELKRRGVI